MTRDIRWSSRARDDLAEIFAYISRDSENYARAMVRRLLIAPRKLADFPNLGRHVPEIADDDIRELIVRKYRLVYRIEPTEVVIIGVIHGARRLLDALGDRPV